MKFIPEQEAAGVKDSLQQVFYLEIVTLILHYLFYFISNTSTEENCITYQWQKINKEYSPFVFPHLQALYPFVDVGYTELDHAFGELLLAKSKSIPLLRWGIYYRYRNETIPNRPETLKYGVWTEWIQCDAFLYDLVYKRLYYNPEDMLTEPCLIQKPNGKFPIFEFDPQEMDFFFPKNSFLDPRHLPLLYQDSTCLTVLWSWTPDYSHCQHPFEHCVVLFTFFRRIFRETNSMMAVTSWCKYFWSRNQ